MCLQTEYAFTLPEGYLDSDNVLHREGVMRLATAADEILPLKDPRVQQNPAYLSVILLSRVITRLGTLSEVSTDVIEHLFARDLAFLQDMYQRLNAPEPRSMTVTCPQCGCQYPVALDDPQTE